MTVQQRVWKFPINVADESTWELMLPKGGVFLHAAEQGNAWEGAGSNWIALWVMFPDPGLGTIEDAPASKVHAQLRIYGTGHTIKEKVKHIATVPMSNGFVWHVFIEEKKK